MKVILLADIKGVGKKGQVIDASDGHARNFLLPRKLAMEATRENLDRLESKQKSVEHKKQMELDAAKKLKAELEGKIIKISVKKGETGKLFGSVSGKEIAEALSAQENIQIDSRKIQLDKPIKTLGQAQVDVKLYADVAAKITVEIV